MGPAQTPGARAWRCISLRLQVVGVVLLVCGEWCREKRRVAPDRVLPADPQVVAGVYRQCRDVLQELLELDLLLAELVEGFHPVGVGHAEFFLFSCLCSKLTVYGRKWKWFLAGNQLYEL